MTEDREIIQQVLDGEVDKFEILIEKYRQKVFTIVGKRIPYQDHHAVAQDVFLNCYRSLSGFILERPFENWLARIALRTCCDYWREHAKDRHTAVVPENEDHNSWLELAGAATSLADFEAKVNREETLEILEIVLRKLNPEDRMLVEMVYFDGMSLQEAADLLEWKLSKVKVRAMRARQKMRESINAVSGSGS